MDIAGSNGRINGSKGNGIPGLRADTGLRAGEVCTTCDYNPGANRFEETCIRTDPNGPAHTYITETRACTRHYGYGM